MTFQPPPPPPPPPGPPGGQPPSQWGPPPGQPYQPPRAGFDPKTVNNLDWGILATGLLAFIFSFVSYYSYSVKGFGGSASWDAWHGFFGWFAMLTALIGSAAVGIEVFAPHVKLPVANRLIALGGYALSTLCVILALFVVPDPGGIDSPDINKGHGFGYWISLIVIIVGLVLCVMRFQQTGGELPGALASRMPGQHHGGPGAPPPPPAPGYGPPPPAPGYGPPPPMPPQGPPPGPPQGPPHA
jgi:hypothetical protein